jgi:hypothetical protein
MRSNRRCRWSLAGALFAGSTLASGAIQVVGDGACGYYDVDIAAFATCVDGRVVKPDATPATPPPAAREAVATSGVAEVVATPARRARPRADPAPRKPAVQSR